MERYFFIAGSLICVSGTDQELFSDAGPMTAFETNRSDYDRILRCRMVDSLSPPDGELVFRSPGRMVFSTGTKIQTYIGAVERDAAAGYIRVERVGPESVVEMKRSEFRGSITAKSVLTAMEAEHIAIDNGGFILHASCICHEGRAILFTAPSGTGKSTQADLWHRYRAAEIINGDRIMVQLTEKGAQIVGIPFSGSSGICKNSVIPLRAIICLTQGFSNIPTPLSGVAAFRKIWEGCSFPAWDREDTARCMQTVSQTIADTPIFHLPCTPDESAVIALEQALRKQEVL